ncbi:two-partner secretion domain-containing protein [Pantoea septica]|uniref:two-partner secretion domain-containing protein n=2 Tax=Pantoea TaxID=53335 RepID=UPI0028AA36CD|nr:filamentous hemagglutinin N-terminal domain-containing protein [Pantoea septica]
MMKKSKLNPLFLVISVLASPAVLANPSTWQHANGTTVVDINAADANGLSHNMWTEFNVGSNGTVLNNSTADLVRESGNIAKNPNLAASAKVILNEVISNKASQLKGALEVAGQTADVIIANPNGITCTGCSFINTSRTTLTTGTPVMTDGALTGFNVKGGTVTASGLKNAQSYTDILAETIKISGQLETGSLNAIAGKYSYDRSTGAAVSDGASASGVGIDISALGGVTAGVIQLQTTQAGSGVNNKGILSADTLQISSNGILSNDGTLSAQTLRASSTGNMSNNGALKGTNIQLISSKELSNSGTVDASGVLAATTASHIVNKGTMQGTSVNQLVSYAGNITNNGTLASAGTVNLISGFAPDQTGALAPYANTSITNSGNGTISGNGGVTLQAVNGVSMTSGSLSSQGQVYLAANSIDNRATVDGQNLIVYSSDFANQGTMTASKQLTATGLKSITNSGVLKGDVVTLNTNGKLDTQKCSLFIFCSAGTISAGSKLHINAASVESISSIGGKVIAPVVELNTSGS